MPEIENLGDLMHAYTQHFEQGEYQQALDLITAVEARFAVYRPVLIGWKMGLVAMLGDTEDAVAMLDDAVSDGIWFHEEALRQSPDVAALQDIPRFQALVERCAVMRQQAEAAAAPQRQVWTPGSAPEPWPLLIALHGNLGSLAAFAPYWDSLPGRGWLAALVQSSCPTWVSGFYDWPEDEQPLAELRQHYDAITGQYPVDPARVVVAGYSMGGQIAMQAALNGTIPARGFIGVEGWVFDLDRVPPLLESGANPGLRVYLVTGQGGQFRDDAPRLCELLRAHGIACEVETTRVKRHGFPADFEDVVGRALAFVAGERR